MDLIVADFAGYLARIFIICLVIVFAFCNFTGFFDRLRLDFTVCLGYFIDRFRDL